MAFAPVDYVVELLKIRLQTLLHMVANPGEKVLYLLLAVPLEAVSRGAAFFVA